MVESDGERSPSSTRDRVLAAALAQFAQRGVEATSLDAVAVAVGVRKQTVLYYFPSKDHLLRGVVDHAMAELGLILAGAARSARAGAPDDQVRAIVDAVLRLGARRPELLALLREVSRLGSTAVDLPAALEPLVAQAVGALAAAGVDPERARRALLTAGAKVIGMATEVEVLRDLGVEPDRAALRRRRTELLTYLRTALA